MIERHIHAVRTDAPGLEDLAATRERLGGVFPRGATRRMTQLGLLIGGVLHELAPVEDDTLVYASSYAETRALEDYLASFPNPSPTLFQTSIHPSAVQQALIARQQPVRALIPHSGSPSLVAHALRSALLADSARVLFCGGEERGTWLRDHGFASSEAFAFALSLSAEHRGALATLRLETSGNERGELSLPAFFAALHQRQNLDQDAAAGLRVQLSWH